ncbi:nuclear transport factor 2 family protein [Streptomyces sp. NBC_01622]|uniref:ester cyclase n=1 Tax=Streptomyces sp. NBC_01622 TaxID=2975903 RepID=UPI00386C79A2|nr:nuclear transport factor 2 family protein [Streptomyces sp. NBC_01622]
MTTEQHTSAERQLVLRYFEMWNTGDSTVAGEVLHPEWRDHAHPEITGPDDVRRAMDHVRAAQPDLRFDISAVLSEGELLAAVGEVSRGAGSAATVSELIWLIRVRGGLLAEMWTYRRDERT